MSSMFHAARASLLAVAALWLALQPVMAQPGTPELGKSPPVEPIDVARLGSLSYSDLTLKGRLVSTDYYIPGPGEFPLGEDNWLDLDFQASGLLARESVMTVFWNDQPIYTEGLAARSTRSRITLPLPRQTILADINRLRVQALLRLDVESCAVESPARYLTVFNSSQVRYSYADRTPNPRVPTLSLTGFPAPLFQSEVAQPAPTRFVLPVQPTSAEITAAGRIAARLGQATNGRNLGLEVSREGEDFSGEANLVFVGRRDALPSLGRLDPPSLTRLPDGTYRDTLGDAADAETGILFEAPSPWARGRAVLAVTGTTDAAVERAALAMASQSATRAMRGSYAFVREATATADQSSQGGGIVTTLADLGRGDDTLTGSGEHRVSFNVELPTLSGRNSVPFEAIISRSPLLDLQRSNMRLVLNGVPVASANFKDVDTTRGTVRFDIPTAALRGGTNAATLEFTLYLPASEDVRVCASVPDEQAWVVLHRESSFQLPNTADVRVETATLANFPYPFLREGFLRDTLIVVPDDLGDARAFLRFAATLGRNARAEVLTPTTLRASDFTPALASNKDVAILGLPGQIPLLGTLGGRLPIEIDEQARIVLSRGMSVSVRDATQLGVLQQIVSPWSSGRSALIISGTGVLGVPLAVEALRQGNMAGNAAIISLAEPAAPAPNTVPTPEPLTIGGPRPDPLQVTTYQLRPRIEPTEVLAQRRPPYALYAAGLAAVGAMLVVLLLTLGTARGRGAGSVRTRR